MGGNGRATAAGARYLQWRMGARRLESGHHMISILQSHPVTMHRPISQSIIPPAGAQESKSNRFQQGSPVDISLKFLKHFRASIS